MDKLRKDLLVFGYGLSFLIPFLILMNRLKPGFGWTVLGFIAICIVLSKFSEKPLRLVTSLWVIALTGYLLRLGLGTVQLTFLVIAIAAWIATTARVESLHPVYKVWMKGAHGIGAVIFSVLLTIVYYVVFGIIGFIIRLTGQDALDRKLEANKESYWIKREKSEFEKESYERQF